MLKNHTRNKQSFTLIELLVVISIIGLLASTVFAALGGARAQARDARRKAEIKNIETALDLFYVDKGSYTQPEVMCNDTSYGGLGACGSAGGTGNWDANSDLLDLVTGNYMSQLPLDPINNSTYYYYYEPWNAGQGGYANAGQAYDLCAVLEAGGTFCVNRRN